jgi:hypothetical protein
VTDPTPLFYGKSGKQPRLGGGRAKPRVGIPPQPDPALGEALGTALLCGILADLSAVKQALAEQGSFNRHASDAIQAQAVSNAHQNELNSATARLMVRFAEVVGHVEVLEQRIAALDDRLHTIDGKRSTAVSEDRAENIPAAARGEAL